MLTIKRTDYYDIDWLSSTQVGNYDHPHITKALLGRTLLVLVIVIIIGQSHFHEIMIINHHKCIHMLIFHQFHYIPLRSLNWGKGLLPSWYPLIINIRSLLMISSLPTISCSIPMLLNITTHSYIMQLSTISNISALYANYNINIINDQYQQAASIVILGIFIYYI